MYDLHPPPPTDAPDAKQESDYRRLVGSMLSVTLRLLMVKVGAILVMSSYVGAEIRLDLLFNVFPYFRVDAAGIDFAAIITVSTVVMTATAAALLVVPAVEGGWDRQVAGGRILGLVLAAETYVFEVVRHVVASEVLVGSWAWLPAFELACGAGLAAVAWTSTRPVSPQVAREIDRYSTDATPVPAGGDPAWMRTDQSPGRLEADLRRNM